MREYAIEIISILVLGIVVLAVTKALDFLNTKKPFLNEVDPRSGVVPEHLIKPKIRKKIQVIVWVLVICSVIFQLVWILALRYDLGALFPASTMEYQQAE
jgi:hypothetical protein